MIATQIDKLINNINKTEPVIALNWKEETTNESIKLTDNHMPNLLTTDDLSKVSVPLTQIHNSQGNMTDSESLRRTSNRQKRKAPNNRSKGFLWQLQSWTVKSI